MKTLLNISREEDTLYLTAKPKKSTADLLEKLKLKRIRRELYSQKKALQALDCAFAEDSLEREKELKILSLKRQRSKEILDTVIGEAYESTVDSQRLATLEKIY